MNWILLIFIGLLIGTIWGGWKNGIVKELEAFFGVLMALLIIALIALGVTAFVQENYLIVGLAIVLAIILFAIYHLVKVAALPAKLVAKLPGMGVIDKLLGAVVGALLPVLIYWGFSYAMMILPHTDIYFTLLDMVEDGFVLEFLHNHNPLVGVINAVVDAASQWF